MGTIINILIITGLILVIWNKLMNKSQKEQVRNMSNNAKSKLKDFSKPSEK